MSGMWADPRTGIYCLRKRVPARYRGVATTRSAARGGKALTGDVVKISTGTADRKEAQRRWPGVLAAYAEMEAGWARRLNAVSLTPDTAQEIAAKWAAWVAGDLTRLDTAGADLSIFVDPASPAVAVAEALDGSSAAQRLTMAAQRLQAHAAEALKLQAVEITPDTEPHLLTALRPAVAAAYHQAAISRFGIVQGSGPRWNPLGAARAALPQVPDAPPASDTPAAASLTALFEGWKATTVVKARTVEETRYIVELLARHLGHDDATRIDQAALRDWRTTMKAEGRQNNTWNNRLSMIGAVLAWGVSEGHLATNHAVGLRLRKNRAQSPLPYTDEEAALILNAARAETRPSLRWAHWIMAFTGMRAGEALQLTAQDVRREGGIWFLAVHEDDATKSVKTGQRRNVPVHAALIAEGFIAYAQTIKGDDPLFPDKALDKFGNRGGRAWNVIGKWVRDKVGITDKRKAPDHSWRHRVEDELRAAEVPEDARDAITGHARQTTGRQYGVKGESLRRLHRHVSRLPVPPGVVVRWS